MRFAARTLLASFCTLSLATACSSSDDPDGDPTPTERKLSIPCTDLLTSIEQDPGALPGDKGAILRCGADTRLEKDAVQAKLDAIAYKDKRATSAVNVYRILYRTERGNGKPGYAGAVVYLPDTPIAELSPMVVVSHGSRGQAGICAPSVEDPRAEQVNDDQDRMVFTMVAAGYPVIAPDLAGYANYHATDNPPSGYNMASDVAKSTLDAARAFRKMAPAWLSDDVVLTGHSQGGHTAFSTLAMMDTYGAGVHIAAVAAFVPNWLSQRTWAALFLLASQHPIASDPTPNAVSIWYHYTRAELTDGPGGAAKLFRPDKLAGVKAFVDGVCWGPPYTTLESLGSKSTDLFDPAFTSAVMSSAATGVDCPADEPAKTTCETWIARYLEDRPHLTGAAAQVPILVAYGGMDDAITPDRFQCVLDRLQEDKANLTYCFEPEGMHGELPAQAGAYAVDWIAHQTLGTPLTATCGSDKIELIDSKGEPMKCAPLPPND